MKISYINGSVIGTAESIADIQMLLGTQEVKQTPQRPVESVQKRKKCPICGKKVKFMWEHTKYNHSPDSTRKNTVGIAHQRHVTKMGVIG